jgi:hypothetical protein
VARSHDSRGFVQHCTEVVVALHVSLAGGNAHPNRKFQGPLRVHGGVDNGPWRIECRAHPVAGVLEHSTVVCLNDFSHQLVVDSERRLHRIGIGLPAPGRPLDVGEQECENAHDDSVAASCARAKSICSSA